MNLTKLSFNCFVQLLLPSFFFFEDKINLFVSLLFLFIIIIYSHFFYLYIFENEKVKYSGVLLSKTTPKFKSFWFESLFVLVRNLLRGFIHAFLINNYQVQIFLLSLSDAFFLVLAIRMFNCFEFKTIGVMSVCYCLCLLLFDLLFCLKVNLGIQELHNVIY